RRPVAFLVARRGVPARTGKPLCRPPSIRAARLRCSCSDRSPATILPYLLGPPDPTPPPPSRRAYPLHCCPSPRVASRARRDGKFRRALLETPHESQAVRVFRAAVP